MLFLLVQDTHCCIKNCCVVQSNYTTVRTLLDVDAYTLLSVEVLATKIVTYCINVDSQLVCNAL